MCNRMTTLVAGVLALAISTWIPARAEDKPIRAHYFGNSLTDQLKYDYFKKLSTEAGHPLEWKREMAPGVPVVWHWSQKAKWEKKRHFSIIIGLEMPKTASRTTDYTDSTDRSMQAAVFSLLCYP